MAVPPEDGVETHASHDNARERAAEAASKGLGPRLDTNGTRALLEAVESDPDARVRATALAALVRRAPKPRARVAWQHAARDDDASVRLRAVELAPLLSTPSTRATLTAVVLVLLDDHAPLVAEAAAFALGELGAARASDVDVVDALARVTTGHDDPLVREAAVAALGSIGDDRALPAVLAATRDRPAIRRRAVLALAAFDGPEVEAALTRALEDTDWQVRQAAEDLS
ncbi:MAG TPA: HEAT repeat domain-containing protein [Acidimicrobiia bacterium]|jgi:HEAT repeat protein|nr:HEAT repeat domain-containing protein [Acidimicrobiia bacterium]